MTYALFASVFVIATCGLVYELIAGTLASYLIGDSIFQFSTVIGVYLFAMGIGSYLSRFITRGLVQRFVAIEMLLGLVGGFSAAGLMLSFSSNLPFRFLLYTSVLAVGTLVGLEIPLLIRILKGQVEFRQLVSQVLTLDYVGALAAALLFPILFLPKLGLVRSGILFGLANVAVGWLAIRLFRKALPSINLLRGMGVIVTVLLLGGWVGAGRIYSYSEEHLYSDEVIYAKSSIYQRVVLTRWKEDLRLYLNNNLQFSTRDEYRYHEALVHPLLASVAAPKDVLVLGGGDGLALREILKYPGVEGITLIDLDGLVTQLFKTNETLRALNGDSFRNPKVTVINQDAFAWLDQTQGFYDAVVIDLPDPSNYSVGKLFTTAFYRLVRRHLRTGGMITVQATSPLFARQSYWCIVETIRAAGFAVAPYHVYVPSFGEWGYVLARPSFGLQMLKPSLVRPLPAGLKYLNEDAFKNLFIFPPDMGAVPAAANRLDDQRLVHLYEDEWTRITP